MMPKLCEATLSAPKYSTIIDSSIGSLRIRLCNPRDDGLGSISVEYLSYRLELHAFAERRSRDELGSFPAKFWVLTFEGSPPILLGIHAAFKIHPNGTSEKTFELFRSNEDDRGFYRDPTITKAGKFLILKYESGIVCFDYEGNMNWHIECYYDDEVVRIGDTTLLLRNDNINHGREWSVSLANGNPM